mmetsp:Transcript_52255/g.144702  ORF Transcript_52255/g.144702 Transcript_52255/m.144702 type:complete len:296 (-) Transcript_52255:243-1130(-)
MFGCRNRRSMRTSFSKSAFSSAVITGSKIFLRAQGVQRHVAWCTDAKPPCAIREPISTSSNLNAGRPSSSAEKCSASFKRCVNFWISCCNRFALRSPPSVPAVPARSSVSRSAERGGRARPLWEGDDVCLTCGTCPRGNCSRLGCRLTPESNCNHIGFLAACRSLPEPPVPGRVASESSPVWPTEMRPRTGRPPECGPEESGTGAPPTLSANRPCSPKEATGANCEDGGCDSACGGSLCATAGVGCSAIFAASTATVSAACAACCNARLPGRRVRDGVCGSAGMVPLIGTESAFF